jgi:hypothetical protein
VRGIFTNWVPTDIHWFPATAIRLFRSTTRPLFGGIFLRLDSYEGFAWIAALDSAIL